MANKNYTLRTEMGGLIAGAQRHIADGLATIKTELQGTLSDNEMEKLLQAVNHDFSQADSALSSCLNSIDNHQDSYLICPDNPTQTVENCQRLIRLLGHVDLTEETLSETASMGHHEILCQLSGAMDYLSRCNIEMQT